MKKIFRFSAPLVALAVIVTTFAASAYGKGTRGLATITGTVRDNRGMPLAGALIQLIREGANKAVRETRTSADGSFSAKIPAGRYSLKAIADGFSEVLFSSVTVNPSAEIAYRFNLEPLGAGRTYPEQRNDRDNVKWRLRAAQKQRSIFQANEGDDAAIAAITSDEATADDVTATGNATPEEKDSVRPQGVVETYFSGSSGPFSSSYQGLNFAVALPASERIDLIFAGQTGTGASAPHRFEATARMQVNDRHRLALTTGAAQLPAFSTSTGKRDPGKLGQMSIRAVDEWIVRDGFVVVLGVDYSRFLGAGNDGVLSPRIGVQLDANARTKIKAAYHPGDDGLDIQSLANFESGNVIFTQAASKPIAYVSGRAVMAQSRRFEVGLERELNRRSSLEATAFMDMTTGRGVGLLSTSLSAFSGAPGAALIRVANQEGSARGVRMVYSNRLNNVWNVSGGYSFGRGQKLSARGIRNPSQLFAGSFFHSVALQLAGDWSTGTHVQTVFRFSPDATVFAIDPFAGQLAVYDPSLSIQVTQDLPTFGLPLRAQAVIDARNLLDVQANTSNGETLLQVGPNGRSLRGGISVRF
ncbi:MAG TPA: carboxypeptidase-like regulatory domain-containing protein [Pyrinomonadaceae bacterium]|nr:carboxypeptidase-like regulatory domain-containing protein [Pyrinomonadaceae bacterium]